MEKKTVTPGGGFGYATKEDREKAEAERQEKERKAGEVEDKSIRGPKEQPKP